MTKSTRIAIRVDEEMRAQIDKLAKAEDRSMSYYIERVLREHLALQPSPPSRQTARPVARSKRST